MISKGVGVRILRHIRRRRCAGARADASVPHLDEAIGNLCPAHNGPARKRPGLGQPPLASRRKLQGASVTASPALKRTAVLLRNSR